MWNIILAPVSLNIRVEPANELSGPTNLGYSVRYVICGITLSVWVWQAWTTANSNNLMTPAWCCPFCFKHALPFHDCSSITNNSSSLSLPTPSPNPPQCHRQHQNELSKNLTILYTNCHILLPKLDFLRAEALSSRPHVIVLTETWIDLSISNHEIFVPGYSPICRYRSCHGGGILLYISESLIINSTNINKTSELLLLTLDSSMGLSWLVYTIAPHPHNLPHSLILSLPWRALHLPSWKILSYLETSILTYFNLILPLPLNLPTLPHHSIYPKLLIPPLGKQTIHLLIMCIHRTLDSSWFL